ncbi:conserved hypothetical protein [Histoplasma capsulatum var. duboisii H88]|uniref:DUF7730 domain-containing protein n=1 Tax=Ajellomyces capsulatus (strain H88) TaxID=544711 RepID=F0U6A6_AJEC8|nr:conserved hypothetical protein [Histoplasma capsulatum var. duboisii H88]QSS52131.1 hypothetical protein I7I53_07649 [Histoplasma capsulatum var. duboisii H88]
MPNPYYTFPPDAPLNSSVYCHNRSDKSPPRRPRLSTCRRRGITHPLPDWVESPFSDPWAYTDPQSSCTLYTVFPPEIRFLIFEALLCNRVLHMNLLNYRGYKVLKACRQTGVRWERKFWDTVLSGYYENARVTCQCGHGSQDSLCLAILRTCRRIYSECIPLLYTRNIFNFGRDVDASFFTSRPLHKRFQSVSCIEVNIPNCYPHYSSGSVTREAYQKLLAPFVCLPPMKILRLRVKDLPRKSVDVEEGLSREEAWLAPVDKLVRQMASTLEELEFVIPAWGFELLCCGEKANVLDGAGDGEGGEEEVFCNERRGGKRCRRRLEGLRPGVQYWISCPAAPDPSP